MIHPHVLIAFVKNAKTWIEVNPVIKIYRGFSRKRQEWKHFYHVMKMISDDRNVTAQDPDDPYFFYKWVFTYIWCICTQLPRNLELCLLSQKKKLGTLSVHKWCIHMWLIHNMTKLMCWLNSRSFGFLLNFKKMIDRFYHCKRGKDFFHMLLNSNWKIKISIFHVSLDAHETTNKVIPSYFRLLVYVCLFFSL